MINKPQSSSVRPSAPPLPNEDDTLQYFDAVIDSCDADRARKPPVDDGNADVDFIGRFQTLFFLVGIGRRIKG